MNAKIISIGNSKGVRIPKAMLEECHIGSGQAVSLTVVNQAIVITPAKKPRDGWAQSFQTAGVSEENLWEGLSPTLASDEADWQW